MAGKTIRAAIGSLGSTLWNNYKTRPFHQSNDPISEHTVDVRKHLAAIESVSPARKYQKAITPEFLRCMASLASLEILNDPEDHATDIIIVAYFFAMRSCEFSDVPEKGRTVNIHLGGIRFYSSYFALIPHHHPRLLELSAFVWVLFEDRKNRLKCDAQNQARTKDPKLCPVCRLGRAVQRVLKFAKNHDKDTPLCTFHQRKRRSRYINQKFCRDFLRKVCRIHGGVK